MPGTVYDAFEELAAYEQCAVPLSRYAQLIGYDECAFWGVVYPDQVHQACSTLWSEFQRQEMAWALAEAQQDIEMAVGYPLCPTWVVGDLAEQPDGDDRWVDNQPWRGRFLPAVTRYTHLIEPGVRATEAVATGAAVNHTSDPAVIGPLPTDAASAGEIRVYYPDSAREITPSRVTLAAGEVTIEIPRCRVVQPNRLNNPDSGWDYEDLDNFLEAVDVRREYTDPSRQAVLVRPGCDNGHCTGGCGECTHDACLYVRNGRVGVVDVRPATYDAQAGEWKAARLCKTYSLVRLNYRCGLRKLSTKMEMAIVRLAHAKAPEAPCGCSHTEHLWRKDRHIPEVLTAERLNCPFGLEQGAWVAWKYAQSLKMTRMGVL